MKTTPILLVAAAFCVSTASLKSETLLSDTFAYPDGDIAQAAGSPWTVHSGSTSAEVLSESLRLDEGRSQDVNALLAGEPHLAESEGLAIYGSFTLRCSELPNASGGYFAHLLGGSSQRGKIWVREGAGENTFKLGNLNSSGSSPSAELDAELSLNTDYRVVFRYQVDTGVSTLWLDPDEESDAGATAVDEPGVTDITAFAFRQSSGIGVLHIDDLRIGTAFTDVAGANLPPTISAIADQSASAGTVIGPLEVLIGDDLTAAESLELTAESDNEALIPLTGITFGGTGENRTVTLQPVDGAEGVAKITVRVSDGATQAGTSFTVIIGEPAISSIANRIIPMNGTTGFLEFEVNDAESSPSSLVVEATASNADLIAQENVVVAGDGAGRTLSIVPNPDVTGWSVVTVSVFDGTHTVETRFVLTVQPELGLIFEDEFDRADGPVVPSGGQWLSHSGTEQETQLSGGRLALSQNATEDVSHILTAGKAYDPDEGAVFHASFLVRFLELPTGQGSYFAHFRNTSTLHRCRVIASTVNAEDGKFRLSIGNALSDILEGSQHPFDLSLNEEYRIVIRYNTATGESRLWVDPVDAGSDHVDARDEPRELSIEAFAFRQANTGGDGMGVLEVDELRIGTAFTDVLAEQAVHKLNYTWSGTTLLLHWPVGSELELRSADGLPALQSQSISHEEADGQNVVEVEVVEGAGFYWLQSVP